MVDHNPLSGSSDVMLPKFIKSKKAVTNMQNKDNQYFKWCVTRALNPVEVHPERITKLLEVISLSCLTGEVSNFQLRLTT